MKFKYVCYIVLLVDAVAATRGLVPWVVTSVFLLTFVSLSGLVTFLKAVKTFKVTLVKKEN